MEFKNKETRKPLLWVAMGSITMMFAGLTSGYLVRRAEGNWLLFELPIAFYFSTAIIIISSITMIYAVRNAKKEENKKTLINLFVTLFLSGAFVFFQIQGWNHLLKQGVFFTGAKSNAAGSFLYVLTFLHLIHVFAGVVSLIVSIFATTRKKYTKEKTLGLELTAMFWHFLSALWLYLFLFLLFVR